MLSTLRRVPYTEKTTVWDKARVARILQNAKYTGSDDYAPIVDDELYDRAVALKTARQRNTFEKNREGIDLLRSCTRCAACGAPMHRRVNAKLRIRESWECTNPECGIRVRISDAHLLEIIVSLMNRLIENDTLLLPKKKRRITSDQARAITWAYRKRFEDGKVLMQYKSMLGYRKGADGEPEIVPEEAKIVTRIFDMFLSGQTVRAISEQLRSEQIHIPGKNISFSHVMVYNILRNEKYCGDSILQKTITVDCISKTRRDNMGEAPMYYVQNSHPAIISREIYHMTQAEIARRKTLAPASEKKAVTVAGKYSKYALSEVLVCGECGSRYRRVTWTSGGKRVVWRCSNRLENGKKYCKMSLTVKEESLHAAIVRAINKFNSQDHAAYLALMKATIGEALGIQAETAEIDELKRRIDALNQKMVSIIQKAARDGEDIEEHESEFKEMAESIALFKQRISVLEQAKSTDAEMSERMAKIQEIIDERQAHQDVYDDSIVRQMIECIKVFSNGNIEVYFGGGNCIHETIAFD